MEMVEYFAAFDRIIKSLTIKASKFNISPNDCCWIRLGHSKIVSLLKKNTSNGLKKHRKKNNPIYQSHPPPMLAEAFPQMEHVQPS